jgi:hypothetical protein
MANGPVENPGLAKRSVRTYVRNGVREQEIVMKAFLIAVVIAVGLAAGVGITLSNLNESAAQAYSTEAVRLDQSERVNDYGRQPEPVQSLPKS